MHRCHSVRDSHVPASFFHDVFVASENTAIFVALLTLFSASPPRKPMRVILLRYIRFSVSARLSRAPGSEGRGSQDQKLLFWGDRHGGARTGTEPKAKQKLRRRRAPQEPRSCAETDERNRERAETVATWFVKRLP